MTDVLQFPLLTGNASRDATPAADYKCAIIQFPSIALNDDQAIDAAATDGDLETMMKPALHGRSTEARNRASVWLQEVHNVRVM